MKGCCVDKDLLGPIKEKHILVNTNDINMVCIENIIAKYIGYVEGCLYVKGRRLPLTNKRLIAEYKKLNMLSEKPFHPLYSPELLKNVIELLVIDTSGYEEDYFTNKLTGVKNKIYENSISDNSVKDIVLSMTPDITKVDYDNLIGYMNKYLDKIYSIIEAAVGAIIDVDISSHTIELNVYDNVLTYRYKETWVYKESNGIPMANDVNYDIVE